MNSRSLRTTVITIAVTALVALGLWISPSGPSAEAASPHDGRAVPAGAPEVAPDVFYLGSQMQEGVQIEGYAIVRRALPAKPEGNPGGGKKDKGDDGDDPAVSCFTLIAGGFSWNAPTDFTVDASGRPDSLSVSDVETAFVRGAAEWNGVILDDAFGTQANGTAKGAVGISTNGTNEAVFGSISDFGVIGVTYIWGVFRGPPSGRGLVEWDMKLDSDSEWDWQVVDGATTDNDGVYVVDVKSIVVHELGHALGLGHAPDTCPLETMFSTYGEGETYQRDIYDGDIEGAQSLYGVETP